MSERDLQKAVAQYLDLKGWLYCHVPNGARLGSGKQAAMRGKRLKEEGLKPGVPDILIFEKWTEQYADPTSVVGRRQRSGHGIAIELKFGKNKTTSEQDLWLYSLHNRGWKTAICRTINEVVELCDRLLGDVRR